MTVDRMIELLNSEHDCMLRNSHGDCNRDCANCDLVQDDGELHDMYTSVISLLKAQENEIEELKQEIEGHKDNLRETLDEMMRYADELKMQEPHIMTLEEWREWKRKPLSQRDPVYYVDDKGFGSWIAPNDQLFIYATPELGYGILFVCWTSRPTDEQMKTQLWE